MSSHKLHGTTMEYDFMYTIDNSSICIKMVENEYPRDIFLKASVSIYLLFYQHIAFANPCFLILQYGFT